MAELKSDFLKKIKSKKELQGLADSVVTDCLNNYLKKNNINFSKTSEKERKIILKEIRSGLRLLVGRFQKSIKNKKSLLSSGELEDLLKTHSSTSERLAFYPEFKRLLKQIDPRSILDLGCGLNPIAIASKQVEYFASDINEGDLNIISDFFNSKKIKGKTFVADLQNLKQELPKTDVCLILKVLDVIDPNHKISGDLLDKIQSKILIVSFSTRKLSGKKMNFPRRFWFENLLNRKRLPFETIESENEFFYIITKN
ncbi:MAG: hypothetical protein ABH864_04215 [archaeon]